MTLILASTSPVRARMLDAAGVPHAARAPNLDEDVAKRDFDGDPGQLALFLAAAKAESCSAEPGDWVIGSDSTLSVDGVAFSKPRDRAEAARHLAAFSGKTMTLSSAVALAQDGRCRWRHGDTATLAVRTLTPGFIEAYLDAEWPEVSYCVGVFRIEGRGITLFDRVDGSHFTILGMPLLPLLGALRERDVIAS